VKTSSAILIMLIACAAGSAQSEKPMDSSAKQSSRTQLEPSPEMDKVLLTFVGNWKVSERFEVSASKQGRTRQGQATFKTGPGLSLVEDYHSDGTAGELRFLGVLWWDPKSSIYQFFTCANNGGCSVRGTAQWDHNDLVNTWEEEVNGKKTVFRDSFLDISPGSFTLVSEGVSDGVLMWRVVTKYVRSSTP
jgi:hypothetical protein